MENYIKELNFSSEDIELIKDNNPKETVKVLETKQRLVENNLNFLEDYGIKNNRDIFLAYPEIFLQEPSVFQNIFTKYKKDDLIQRLEENIETVTLL